MAAMVYKHIAASQRVFSESVFEEGWDVGGDVKMCTSSWDIDAISGCQLRADLAADRLSLVQT